MILACISFFALGTITASIGPSIPDLADKTSSSLSSVGGLFTGLFFGALAAQGLAALLLDRIGPRLILTISLAALGVCMMAVLVAPSLPLIISLGVLAGIGHGMVNVTTNVTIADTFPNRRASAVNLINMFYGLGAIAGPAIAGLTLRLWGTALPALWLGSAVELLLSPVFFFLLPQVSPQIAAGGQKVHARLWTSPLLWLMSAVILVYVGNENGFGGWISSYMEQAVSFTPANAALSASAFWLALTGGRALASYLGTRLQASQLLKISILTATAGAGALVLGHANAPVTLGGIVLLGLGFGPIYPTTIAIITAAFPAVSGTAASIIAAAGSLGGMSIPWLQGVALENSGSFAAILVTFASTLLMLIGLAVLRRVQRIQPDPVQR